MIVFVTYIILAVVFQKVVASLGPIKYFDHTEMTIEIFESLFLNGNVAIIRGGSSHWPLAKWSCEDFRNHPSMKEHKLERVYGENDGSFVTVCDTCEKWENDKRRAFNDDPSGPQFAPLFWDVKTDPTGKVALHNVTPHWSFVNKKNEYWKFHGIEVWISPPNAGAMYHIDGHLQMTVVSQMTGTRRWRLQIAPDESDRPTLIPSHLDSNRFSWTPEHELVLNTGDMVVFPPGSIHDTLNIGDSCAVSVTHQLNIPFPAKFYRRHMGRLLTLGDQRESWPIFVDLATFGFLRPKLTLHAPFFRVHNDIADVYQEENAVQFMTFVYKRFFLELKSCGHFGKREMREYVAFHDMDGDGSVSEEEFIRTFSEWFEIEYRVMDHVLPKFRPLRFFYEKMEEKMHYAYAQELKLIESLHRNNLNVTGDAVVQSVIEELLQVTPKPAAVPTQKPAEAECTDIRGEEL